MNDWILYSQGQQSYAPQIPIEEVLDNKSFSSNPNYGIAIGIYLDQYGINYKLLDYLKTYSDIPIAGFNSLAWGSITANIAHMLHNQKNNLDKNIVKNITEQLLGVGQKLWLNYVNLQAYYMAIMILIDWYRKNILPSIDKEKEHAYLVQNSLVKSLLEDIYISRVRKTFFKNLKANLSVNEWRSICFEVFQIFQPYLSLSSESSGLNKAWQKSNKKDIDERKRLCKKSMQYVLNVIKTQGDELFEVIPILDKVEQSAVDMINHSGSDTEIKAMLKACEDLWNYIGLNLAKSLFDKVREKEAIGKAVLDELGEFYSFIVEGSKKVPFKQEIEEFLDALTSELTLE
jgi:hypothetical protein